MTYEQKQLLKKIIKMFNISNINFLTKKRLSRLKNRDFTIISNNCWGGMIYQKYGIKYNSPTIGLYFYANDYIKFLQNLEYYLMVEPIPIELGESVYYKELKSLRNEHYFPIIKLDDIEVIFLHYKTDDEAVKKWNYRKKRINMDNLIVKFNDQNGFNEDLLDKFNDLKFKHKICFTGTNYGSKSIYVKQYRSKTIKNDMKYFNKPVNMTHYLNKLVL